MSDSKPKSRLVRTLFWPVLILILALGGGYLIIRSGPTTQAKEEPRTPKMVKTMRIVPSNEPLIVSAYGSVIPARQVTISPQVRGRVVRHHPALEPGGYLPQDTELIGIERSEYELVLTEKEAALEEAIYELEVEQGRQVVASREWLLLQEELQDSQANQALVLRKPHLRRTEAMLQKASNEIAKAQLSLTRTSVKAPFNAMVLSETVEVGEVVNPGSTLATLVGTDEFWVQASLPVEQLKWIKVPSGQEEGAVADIVMETGNGESFHRQGNVLRLLSDLELKSRMARLLIRVTDPLGLDKDKGKLPLLLGSYVRVDIAAGQLKNVLSIQRTALHEKNIWTVGSDKKLRIKPVEILWTQKETLLIKNILQPDESLIISGLRVALPGMDVTPIPVSSPEKPSQVTKSQSP